MKRTAQRRNVAFTLIELLVVIMIIGILAALIIPAAGSVRRAAQLAKCKNNAKQIMLGITQFCNDNDRRLPSVGSWENLWSNGKLDRYIAQPAIYECPSDRGCSWPGGSDPSVFNRTKKRASYMYAENDRASSGIYHVTAGSRGFKMNDPALLASSLKAIVFEPTFDTVNMGAQIKWHNSKRAGTIAFLDGHADFVITNHTSVSTNYDGLRYY